MKKFSFLLLFVPVICFGGSLDKQVANNYDWSTSITASADVAWQIYNSSNNTKTTFITGLDLSSDAGGYFTIYSTTAPRTGFTGSKIGGTATPSQVGASITAVSSVTTSVAATLLSGDIKWQGVLLASDTYKVLPPGKIWKLTPGHALYVIKSNEKDSEKASASFRFVETYR